jgi:lipoate-protein ligase B
VNTDLSYFDRIVPCGIPDVKMTSVQRWLAQKEELDMADAEDAVIRAFSKVFNRRHTKTLSMFEYKQDEPIDIDFLLDIEKQLEAD